MKTELVDWGCAEGKTGKIANQFRTANMIP